MSISKSILSDLKNYYQNEPINNILTNSISNNRIKTIVKNRDILSKYNNTFSNKRNQSQSISNQFGSGRCWIFSFTNIIRNKLIEKYNLNSETFHLSNNFLFFYDKLEKCNFYLENILDTKDLELDEKILEYFLEEPINDGGQWNMVINLVEKYGLVPFDYMKETKHTHNSYDLNKTLASNLKFYTINIREKKKKINKNSMLKHIYKILCFFLGTPPNDFIWEFYDNEKKYTKHENLNPIKFYKKFVRLGCGFNSNDYVVCINYPLPEYKFNKVFKLEYCNNMVEGGDSLLFNLPIEDIKRISRKSINDNESLWFGCDVGKYFDNKTGILDTEIYNYDTVYNEEFKTLTKGDKLRYKLSEATHAMIIIGYNKIKNKINRWLVENSWGKKSGDDGHLIMSDKWFDKYVYMVVVNKKYLTKKQLDNYNKNVANPISVEPWGILSCEALNLN